MEEEILLRIYPGPAELTLIFLPGLHGDSTLVASFRQALAGRARFVEFTYPRTVTWTLADYAAGVAKSLLQNGITRGWLLGESFSSQVVWPLVDPATPTAFSPDGAILAGGFGRYPIPPVVPWVKGIIAHANPAAVRTCLRLYARYAGLRHRNAPETMAAVEEFVARRTAADLAAACHRLDLIYGNDPRLIMSRVTVPIFYLTGFVDPVVPWPFAWPALRRGCPALREAAMIASADHNVLGTAPRRAAVQILSWIENLSRHTETTGGGAVTG